MGPRCGGAGRHRREARRQQPLGVRRPAVLGRRGRLLHQRLHAGERRLAGSRRHRLAALVPRPPSGRRRLELRVGGGLDAVLVPLHPQRAEGDAVLRASRPAATDGCARPVTPPRSTCSSATCCTGSRRASRSRSLDDASSPTRSAGSTRAQRRRLLPCRVARTTAARPTLASRRRSRSIRPATQPDGTWLQEQRIPAAPGSRWTCRSVEPSPWLTFFATRALAWWDENAKFDRS